MGARVGQGPGMPSPRTSSASRVLTLLAGIAIGGLVVFGAGIAFEGWGHSLVGTWGHSRAPTAQKVSIVLGHWSLCPSNGTVHVDPNGTIYCRSSTMVYSSVDGSGTVLAGSEFTFQVTIGNWYGAPLMHVYNMNEQGPFQLVSVAPALPQTVALHGNMTFTVSFLAPDLQGQFSLGLMTVVG